MCLNFTERRKLCASVCLARPSNISCGLALVKSQNASEEADSSPGCGIGMTVKGGSRPRGGVCVKTYPQGVFRSGGLQAGTLFSTRCPAEAGLYEMQTRIFTQTLSSHGWAEAPALANQNSLEYPSLLPASHSVVELDYSLSVDYIVPMGRPMAGRQLWPKLFINNKV